MLRKPILIIIAASVAVIAMLVLFKNSIMSKAQSLIAKYEGYSANAYLDDNDGWTIGYGHLIKKGEPYYPYGTVKTISKDEALSLLANDMQIATNCVNKNVKVSLNQNQREALISFVYNIGCEQFKNSTLLKKLNASDYSAAANEFPKWNKDDGKVLAGLVTRRSEERNLFLA